MSCECSQCRQHYKVLGFMFGVPTEEEFHAAYREAIKQWHPDLYENFASLRAEAEERFKEIQVAFRELKEHNGAMVDEPPEGYVVVEDVPSNAPSIALDGELRCLLASQFTSEIQRNIARFQGSSDTPLAIVDLTTSRSVSQYTHFLLLSARGIMVRDARELVALLWYKDLGEVSLIDRSKAGKPSFSQRLLEKVGGAPPKLTLQIQRDNGTLFASISDPVDEKVLGVVYEFLLRQKALAQR